jgi:hypothetical protein
VGEERIRIGLGEGLSWVSAIPIVEIQDSKNNNVAKLLTISISLLIFIWGN